MKIEELLKVMVEKDASDIYLTAGFPPTYRVEGKTAPVAGEPLSPEVTERLAFSVMSEKQKAEFLEEKEMNLALHYPSLGRFRVSIFVQKSHISLVIRQIKLEIKTLDDLGMPPVLKDIAMTKRGLVLVVGATGSGKSTTQAAMIDHRNSNSPGHIITVEDPIEFVHSHKLSVVNQREVGLDTLSFNSALKNTLRQAPDVILVGEVRDTETMEAVINFAETGHLCLATLHANNANQSIERVINFFHAERHEQIYQLLSLNLKAIVSQRLIPTEDGKRVAVLEVLLDTPRVKDLIQKKKIALLKEAMKQGVQEGMQTFDQAIYDCYIQGKITYKTAIAYADSANDVRLRIKAEGVGTHVEEDAGKSAFKLRSEVSRT
ncbi:MAG: PilT/PilU family type 4a pilus ATPase [Candidatus Brocadiales bacterium]